MKLSHRTPNEIWKSTFQFVVENISQIVISRLVRLSCALDHCMNPKRNTGNRFFFDFNEMLSRKIYTCFSVVCAQFSRL